MDFKKIAGDLVEAAGNERWQRTRASIQDALDSAYRLGFLDGEAAQAGTAYEAENLAFRAGRLAGEPCCKDTQTPCCADDAQADGWPV